MSAEILVSTKDMSHEEWLKNRTRGIGGSEVASICGISKYSSPYKVYLRKIGELPYEPQSESAHWGNTLEDVVAKEFTRVTGKKVRNKNVMLRSKENDFMIANLDRVGVGEKTFLECKTTILYNAHLWEDDKIPEGYMLQVQHYMYVCGFKYCYIACLIGGQNFVWKKIKRDDELINMMIEIEKNFWFNHVIAKVPPSIVGGEADSKLLEKLYPNSENNTEIELSCEAIEYIEKLNKLKEQKKELEEQIINCENYLKNALQENEIGNIDNYKVVWKTSTRKSFDSKAFKEENEELYKKYLKESQSRRFSIKINNKECK